VFGRVHRNAGRSLLTTIDLLQVKAALRLSLAVNVVVCSLGIFRVCLLHVADHHDDVIDDVTNRRPAAVNGSAASPAEFLVPNIVHYIWSKAFIIIIYLLKQNSTV